MIQPGVWKHSQSEKLYRVHYIAKHPKTLEEYVVYEAMYENNESQFWIRPVSTWKEIIEVNRESVPRFVFIRDTV